jgi:hypothetical protein
LYTIRPQLEVGEERRKQREAVRHFGQVRHLEVELSQVGQAADALVELVGWVPRAGSNTQLLKVRASFRKGAEEEEEEGVGGCSRAAHPTQM